MKCLFWNIRGIANLPSRRYLKNLYAIRKPEFIFIAEPWILFDKLNPSFWKKLNLKLW